MTEATRLAVVTGGNSGIGYETAIALASEGWDVAVSYIHDDAAAATVARQIESHGRRAWVKRCDVGIREDVEHFFDHIVAAFGTVPTLLVNNAAVQTWSPFLHLEEAHWDQVIRTNLKGCFLNTQKAAKLMIKAGRRGTIINIGSGCNKVPFPNLVDYSASKSGIEQLTRLAAVEFGPHGITVNCVAPGAIENERTRQEVPDYAATWARITPMRRVGTPADVINAILFLAREESNFITGQTLNVDGGVFTQPNWPY
ncbi:SDR family NAD(P)-dependent oxidoreductase [Steroidobacter flavus]|uniref:SDR family NAD(P)-dependent oxidoreductase n=1 Tax=Steroidobacter flavus TaxID=1842136 RepID=A0ABV8SWV2_9GAMM